MLRAAGIGVDQIAKLAGLSSSHVRGLIYPSSRGKPPFQKVRRETAERILAVPADDSSRAANSHVDATGTRRRLQALVAVGWAQAWLARELHRSPANLRRSMTSRHRHRPHRATGQRDVRAALGRRAARSAPAQRRASDAARAFAADHGWLPPLAWDDIDHDDDPDPFRRLRSTRTTSSTRSPSNEQCGRPTVRLTHAEQIEVVRRMSERGRSIRTIADTLSTSTRTVSRHRKQSSAA